MCTRDPRLGPGARPTGGIRPSGPAVAVAIAALLLTYVLLFTSVEIVAGNPGLYGVSLADPETERVTGLSAAGRREVLGRILSYALGRRSDMQFTMPAESARPGEPAFSADELQHMEDVRGLFALGRKLRAGAMVLSALLVLLALSRSAVRGDPPAHGLRRGERVRAVLAGLFRWTAVWGGGLLVAIGTAALLDFRTAFDAMHKVLFTNDLWQLPLDSLLIQLLPEVQFARLGAYAGCITLAAVVTALCLGLLLRRSRRSMHGA